MVFSFWLDYKTILSQKDKNVIIIFNFVKKTKKLLIFQLDGAIPYK